MSAETEAKSPKTPKMALLLIFFTVFIDLVGFGIVIPLLPIFAEKFGAHAFTVGLLLMSYSLMQFFFIPFWGRLSDRVGRRPILLISLAFSAAGYAIWGVSGSLFMLFASRLVAGFGNANLAVAQAYIADVTTEENRAAGMGVVGAAFGLGFILGPAIGAFISAYGLNFCGMVAASTSLLDLALTAIFLPEPKEHSHQESARFNLNPGFYFQVLGRQKLSASLAIFFVATFALANMETTLVLLTEKRFGFTPGQNGMMFTYIGFIMILVQGWLIRRLCQKFTEQKLILFGSFLTGIGLLLTGFAQTTNCLFAALGMLAVGSGIYSPSNQSILSKLADRDELGGVMGVGQSLATLGRILGPLAGGAAFEFLGMTSPYILGAVCMTGAFLLAFCLPCPKPAGAASPLSDKTAANT